MKFSDVAGNKLSLRSQAKDQIKRINYISNSMGSLGDFLVTTWSGVLWSVVMIGCVIGVAVNMITKNGFATALQNVIPMILFSIGGFLFALNVVFVNPSRGSQLKVSFKYIVNKIIGRNTYGKAQNIKPFRFYDEELSIVESGFKGTKAYIALFSVRGVYSPVSFPDDLEYSAQANKVMLENIKSDTILSVVNAIEPTKVTKQYIPKNATPMMIERIEQEYKLATEKNQSQNLSTLVIVSCPTVEILRNRLLVVEKGLRSGLSIGYTRLVGREAEKTLKKIYG